MDPIVLDTVQQAIAAKRHADSANFVIRSLDNPSPMAIIFAVLVILIVIWCISRILRPSVSGKWCSMKKDTNITDTKVFNINHNRLTDALWITGTGAPGDPMPGWLDGGIVVCPGGRAILANDTLIWAESGEVWKRLSLE